MNIFQGSEAREVLREQNKSSEQSNTLNNRKTSTPNRLMKALFSSSNRSQSLRSTDTEVRTTIQTKYLLNKNFTKLRGKCIQPFFHSFSSLLIEQQPAETATIQNNNYSNDDDEQIDKKLSMNTYIYDFTMSNVYLWLPICAVVLSYLLFIVICNIGISTIN